MEILLGIAIGYFVCEVFNRIYVSKKYILKSTIKSKIDKLPSINEKMGLFEYSGKKTNGDVVDATIEFKVIRETDNEVKILCKTIKLKNSAYWDLEETIRESVDYSWFVKNHSRITWLNETKTSKIQHRKNVLKSILNGK